MNTWAKNNSKIFFICLFYFFTSGHSAALNLPQAAAIAQHPEEQKSHDPFPFTTEDSRIKIRKINISPLVACYILKHKLWGGRRSETTKVTCAGTEQSGMCRRVHCDHTKSKSAWCILHKMSLKGQK